jgi:glycosyltransferase involved in cell wall biosynthesis
MWPNEMADQWVFIILLKQRLATLDSQEARANRDRHLLLMKILIIDEEFPYPLNNGKRIRSSSLALALARCNDVSYFAYGEEGSPGAKYFADQGLSPYAVRPLRREKSGLIFYIRLLANLFSRYPFIITSYYSRRFRRELENVIDQYDMVISESISCALFLRDITSMPKIIVAHNIETSIWRRYEENERNLLKKAYISVQRRKIERFERRCLAWCNGVTAVSKEDAAAILRYGVSINVTVIENGVDVGYFEPRPGRENPRLLVFTGSMDWRPNQDALRYYVEDILPLLKGKRPDIKTIFVGRDPPRSLRALGEANGVVLTGTVEDVRPYIAEATVYIVPLRIGGGSRLKILEAMAMKKTVVSTSIGAEGLDVTDKRNIIICDNAPDFVQSVIACLDNPLLRAEISTNAYNLVHNKYRWQQIGKKLDGYIKKVYDRWLIDCSA